KKKRLERDKEQAIISGVLAGMANYFEQDPVLFCVMAIAFLILTGFFPGILLYLAAIVEMPKRTERPLDVEYRVGDYGIKVRQHPWDKNEEEFLATVWKRYRAKRRHDLSWRKTVDTYRILVSELMLQQTQVSRVIPQYRAFLRQI